MREKTKIIKTGIKTVIQLSNRKTRKALFINMVLLSVMGALTPFIAWLYSLLINSLSASLDIVLSIIIGYILIQFVQDILELASNHIALKVQYLIENNVIKSVNSKLAKIQLEEMENPDTYDLIDRSLSEISSGITTFISDLLSLFPPIISVITYSLLLMQLNVWYPVLIIIPSIPYFFTALLDGKEKYQQRVSQNKEKRQSEYIKTVMTDRRYAKEIKLFKLTDYITEKFVAVNRKLNKEQIKLSIKQSVRMLFINVLRNLALGICLMLCAYDILYRNRQIGDIHLVMSAVNTVVLSISTFILQSTAINTVFYYLSDWTKLNSLKDERKDPLQAPIPNWDISFENVCFQYPNSGNTVLKDITLSIRHGEKIAIVGENGSGKTTFTNLLLGNYEPTKGSIKVGGIPLYACLDEYRKKSTCTYQNFIRYQLSMLDNLKAGNWGNEIDMMKYTRFGILELAYTLPNGLETQLGQLEPNAYELSGGEWQKLAINRALARNSVNLIVLDEPTAAVDPIIENEIYKDFTKICEGKTAIIVSHRLSTTKLCDRILVFGNGHIIEMGNHEELMKCKGKYFEMFNVQRSFYQ